MSATQNSSSTARLASGLRPAVMRLRRRLANERDPEANLSMTSSSVLAALFTADELTLGALAALERVQPPTMTRTINALEDDGYVTRRPGENDRRQVLIAITDKGRQIVLATRARRDEWLSRRLEELSADERAVLRQAVPILEKLATA